MNSLSYAIRDVNREDLNLFEKFGWRKKKETIVSPNGWFKEPKRDSELRISKYSGDESWIFDQRDIRRGIEVYEPIKWKTYFHTCEPTFRLKLFENKRENIYLSTVDILVKEAINPTFEDEDLEGIELKIDFEAYTNNLKESSSGHSKTERFYQEFVHINPRRTLRQITIDGHFVFRTDFEYRDSIYSPIDNQGLLYVARIDFTGNNNSSSLEDDLDSIAKMKDKILKNLNKSHN